MCFLEGLRAVADFPGERLLVDIGEEDASGDKAGVGVDFEQAFGVEDDGVASFLRRERHRGGAEEPAYQFALGERELQTDPGEGNPGADVLELFASGKFQLLTFAGVRLLVGQFALGGAAGPVLPVGERDAAVAELEQDLLHHVLDLLDVHKKWAFFADPKFDFGPDLSPDRFVRLGCRARCRYRPFNFVPQPRDDVRFLLQRLRCVSADDPRELC